MKIYVQRQVGSIKQSKQEFIDPADLVIFAGKKRITLRQLVDDKEKLEEDVKKLKGMVAEVLSAINKD